MRAVRAIPLAVLLLNALYFAGELRDSYFREWRECSEIKAAFPVVLDLCRRTGVREVTSNLNLTRSFNFYREVYRAAEIDELANFEKIPPNKQIYTLLESRDGDFIRSEGLHVVWHGSISDLVVVVPAGSSRPH